MWTPQLQKIIRAVLTADASQEGERGLTSGGGGWGWWWWGWYHCNCLGQGSHPNMYMRENESSLSCQGLNWDIYDGGVTRGQIWEEPDWLFHLLFWLGSTRSLTQDYFHITILNKVFLRFSSCRSRFSPGLVAISRVWPHSRTLLDTHLFLYPPYITIKINKKQKQITVQPLKGLRVRFGGI